MGAFQQPNDHLQVVWDIAQRLRDLCAAPRRRASGGGGGAPAQLGGPSAGVGASAAGGEVEDARGRLRALTAKELKARLAACGADHAGCLEKDDLVERLMNCTMGRQGRLST